MGFMHYVNPVLDREPSNPKIASKSSLGGLKSSPGVAKIESKSLHESQDAPKRRPRAPKRRPSAPKRLPRAPKTRPRSTQRRPKDAHSCPRDIQGGPRGAQEIPKPFQNRSQRVPEPKNSMFLSVHVKNLYLQGPLRPLFNVL